MLLTAGCSWPDFACLSDEQCTLAGAGVCQLEGVCSYPDSTCDSGQRYSKHAGDLASTCVEERPAGTSSSGPDPVSSEGGDSSSSDSSGPGDPCLEVDCGEHGQCQPIDGEPTCACDPGWIPDGLGCLEDGCPGSRCLWVDALEGDDTNPGTKAAPIQTLARASQLAPMLEPGEGLVLRRGQSWAEPLTLAGLSGTEQEPILIAPFGDDEQPPTVEGGLQLNDAVGVRIEGLRVTTGGNNAVQLHAVDHVTMLGCEVFGASTNCVVISAGSQHTALVDNSVWACGKRFGLALVGSDGALGDSHWLVDNRIDAEGTISAIQLSSGDDIKAVRNHLQGSIDRGLHSRVSGHGWLVGNVIAQSGDDNDAALDHAGNGQVVIRGNTIIHSALPAVLDGGGEWAFNTILHADLPAAINIPGTATGWSLHDNLVMAGEADSLSVITPDLVDATRNVYVEGPAGGCTVLNGGMSLGFGDWQALGEDTRSRCEAVPGLTIPARIGSTQDWERSGLLEAAVPDPGWGGCDDPAGAFDCEGQPLAGEIPAFEGFGHGWPGPPEVQARVELLP